MLFRSMDEARANVGLNPLDPQKDIIEPYYSNWTSPITREEAMNTLKSWEVKARPIAPLILTA